MRAMEIVFYHGPTCADGLASRWVAYKKWPDATFIPFGTTERMTPRQKAQCVDKNVLFVDVAPTIDDVVWLHNNCSLTIYDHHYSTMQMLSYTGFISRIKTVICQHMCGCHILWSQCFPHKPLPWALKYIESRDLWRFSNKNERIISWIISTNLISMFKSHKNINLLYNYLDKLCSSKGWLWKSSHSQKWSEYQQKISNIIHDNVRQGLLTTPNNMMIHVYILKTKFLWMASDITEALNHLQNRGLFMFIRDDGGDGTSIITLRGMTALSVAQQWPNGGGHLMAAGFRTSTTDINSRILFPSFI